MKCDTQGWMFTTIIKTFLNLQWGKTYDKVFQIRQEYTSCNCHGDGCNEDWKTDGQSSALEVSLRIAWRLICIWIYGTRKTLLDIWFMPHIIVSTLISQLFCCSVTNATAWTRKEAAVTQSQESSQDVDPAPRAVSSAKVAIQTFRGNYGVPTKTF